MESVKLDGQRGQILVQVAIMVGVLFAFVALAVDGGQVYAGRRRMQNAADAGALAAAREICFGDDGSLEAAEAAGMDYARERNDAQEAKVEFLDLEGYTVTVVASQTLDTFFAGVIGINTAAVRGEAAATCGKVTTLCNVWPIGFDTTTFTDTQCGTHVLLWTDEPGSATCGEGSEYWCNCLEDDEEPVDLATVADGRAWIDFSAVSPGGYDDPCDSPGGGESELEYRILGENNKGEECLSYIELDKCAAGSAGSGSALAAWQAAGELIDSDPVVYIPLYDPAQSSPISPCTIEGDPGEDVGSQRYFLTDVACVRVHSTCRLCRRDDPTKCNNGPHVIEVEILCDDSKCSSSCGTSVGGIPEPGDVKAVNLIPYPQQ